MKNLTNRYKYFKKLVDYAAKFYINSVLLVCKDNIIEINKKLCEFVESRIVDQWRKQLGKIEGIATAYDKQNSDQLKTKFDENARLLIDSFINRGGIMEEFLNIASHYFTRIIASQNNENLKPPQQKKPEEQELKNLEEKLNQMVQEQFKKIANHWAKEKLQILHFIYTSFIELYSYEHLHNQPNTSGFFKALAGFEDGNPFFNQLMSNLRELKEKVLSWPSLFKLEECFKHYHAELNIAHNKLFRDQNQDNPLYHVSKKILENATNLPSSWDTPLISDECTAHDVLELTKERLAKVMSDVNQLKSLLISAIAYYNAVKTPKFIDESQAQAQTFDSLSSQTTGSCVYTMEGSDVTVEWAPEKFFVASDLHGELDTFQNSEVFSANRELLPCIINGDFIDRGVLSLETAIFLFLLQQLFPNYFIILRGNHEEDFIRGTEREFKQQMQGSLMKIPLAELTAHLSVLQNAINQSDSKQNFESLFKKLFELLPIAAVNHKFLMIHGGIILPGKPCVGDFFKKNTKEFMLNAIYNPGQDTEGISTIDEITGSGRPVFNDNTTCGIQTMGLTALLGHQHHRANYRWGRVLNTNFGTNRLQFPCVLLCSCSPETKIETYDITRRDFQILFPEMAELQLYFCSLPKEIKSRTFATLLCGQFSSDEHITTLMRSIVLYLYACILDNESEVSLDNSKEIHNFFVTITEHETTAYQTLAKQSDEKLMLQHGNVAAFKHMQKVLKQRGEDTNVSFTNALKSFNEQVQNEQTKLDNIVKQNDAKFLELLSQCPSCLVNFIEKEFKILIDASVDHTAEILSGGEKKEENLAKMITALKNLLNFFCNINCRYETQMANVRKLLSNHLENKIEELKITYVISELTDLPQNLQTEILSYLPTEDLKSTSQVCKFLRTASLNILKERSTQNEAHCSL